MNELALSLTKREMDLLLLAVNGEHARTISGLSRATRDVTKAGLNLRARQLNDLQVKLATVALKYLS